METKANYFFKILQTKITFVHKSHQGNVHGQQRFIIFLAHKLSDTVDMFKFAITSKENDSHKENLQEINKNKKLEIDRKKRKNAIKSHQKIIFSARKNKVTHTHKYQQYNIQ